MIKILKCYPKKFHLASWLIKLIEKTKFSHYAIKVDDMIIDITGKNDGIKTHNKEEFYSNYNVIDIHSFDVSIRKDTVINWINKLDMVHYGYMQVFGLFLLRLLPINVNIFRNGRKSMICNELVLRFCKRFLGVKTNKIDNLGLRETEIILNEVNKINNL